MRLFAVLAGFIVAGVAGVGVASADVMRSGPASSDPLFTGSASFALRSANATLSGAGRTITCNGSKGQGSVDTNNPGSADDVLGSSGLVSFWQHRADGADAYCPTTISGAAFALVIASTSTWRADAQTSTFTLTAQPTIVAHLFDKDADDPDRVLLGSCEYGASAFAAGFTNATTTTDAALAFASAELARTSASTYPSCPATMALTATIAFAGAAGEKLWLG